MIKVSVIIPVYNMENYVGECLDSIVNQTLDEIEIIAVNDGSTDNSLLILENYKRRYKNLVIVNQENQGSGIARNRGIELAKGKYILFIDPDDYYYSNNCIELLYNTIENQKIFMCGAKIVKKEGENLNELKFAGSDKFEKPLMLKTQDYTDIYGHTRYMYLREFILKNKIIFPSYRRFQDPLFTVKAIACAGSIYETNIVLYVYRVGYKNINYNYLNCTDIIQGIRDVFQLVYKYNLKGMYINRLVNLIGENMISFCKYGFIGEEKVDKAIEDINQVIMTQNFTTDKNNILSKNYIERYIKDSQEHYIYIHNILNDGAPIIIYGAGTYTNCFFKVFKESLHNISGVYVSNLKQSFRLQGYEVKKIDDYIGRKEEEYVLVVTVPRYHNDIINNLKRLEFKNIIVIDMKKIDLYLNLQKIENYNI